MSSALSSACYFISHFCKQCGPISDCSSRSSLIRFHTVCLYAKKRFEKFARIFSRLHKQMTFSDAGFLGILRAKILSGIANSEDPDDLTLHCLHMPFYQELWRKKF